MLFRWSAVLFGAAVAVPALAQEPLSLRDLGSLSIGGRTIELSGKPVREVKSGDGGAAVKLDPNGQYQVEQLYVQFYLPKDRHGTVPLLFWPDAGLTGQSFETTPDGRTGWQAYFLHRGWDVYLSDPVGQGRAGWGPVPETGGEPVFATLAASFERYRIGAGPGSWDSDPLKRKLQPGTQFPADAFAAFARETGPRWTATGAATFAAYTALVDKVCPCAILAHGDAGATAFRVAQTRPDKIRALVAIEPTGGGDPDKAAALKGVPLLLVYGDFIDKDALWSQARAAVVAFAQQIRDAGGTREVIDLPKSGVLGNSHLMMMDNNNLQVAGLIQDWLAERGLYQ
jgi:pimeloyl-ACP methyl ester carboxylesterase